MTDHIDATQEDCKAAREVFRSAGPAICEAIEYGGCEETAIFSIAQAFTRHRLASTAALQAERDALAAMLIKIAATVTQDASGRWYFDLGDPEQLLSDACAAVGYDVVIAARDALGEG